MKEEARRKHAVAVIWAYWLGLKVLPQPLLSVHGELNEAQHLLTLTEQLIMLANGLHSLLQCHFA